MLASKLVYGIGYAEQDFSGSIQESVGMVTRLGQSLFFPYPFKFIINLSSSYLPAVYSR
jgi:hypothetical protein